MLYEFHKIFYFNLYVVLFYFFYHLIVVLPINNYFQSYQIFFFFFKCASHFNQVRALCLGSRKPLRISAPRCFYSLSLSQKNLLGMMVMYWIHQPVCSSRGEHTTRQCPMLNNLPKIYAGADVCFSQNGDTISSLCHTQWQIHSVLFLGSRVWRLSMTTLPFCMKLHQPRLSK